MNINKNEKIKKNKLINHLIEYKEYDIIKDNNSYNIRVEKYKNEIIIKYKNCEKKLNTYDLSMIIKLILTSINETYSFIIKSFENNKVFIKEIVPNIEIKLLFLIKTFGQEKEIEIKLEKKKKIEFSSNPKNIQFFKELAQSHFNTAFDNVFTIFKSMDDILYFIFSEENSIISYNLIDFKKINEIRNAHQKIITNLRNYLDYFNKRDLIMSLSKSDNFLKIWDIDFDCLISIQKVNNIGVLYSACFLQNSNDIFIITSNLNYHGDSEYIKVFDLNGKFKKKINESNKKTYFIDSYYDKKLSKNYIITGNDDFTLSYDFDNNIKYHKYFDKNNDEFNNSHISLIINDLEEIIKLIESCFDGNIRIWNFHSGELLDKIHVDDIRLYGICLWNKNYLFVGSDNLKLIDLSRGNIIECFKGHCGPVQTIIKIFHPKYGECLISKSSEIKLWINEEIQLEN